MLIDNVSLSKALNGILAAAANSQNLTITLNKDDLEALESAAQRLSINPVGMSEAVYQQQTIQRLFDTLQMKESYVAMPSGSDVELIRAASDICCCATNPNPALTDAARKYLIDRFNPPIVAGSAVTIK